MGFHDMKRLLIPIVLSLMPVAAAADEITSIYSELDLKNCKQLALFEDEGEGGEWLCPGIKDHDVRVWEGDLRSYVGFGKEAPAQCVSAETFGAFNSLGPRVEWRMKDGKPVEADAAVRVTSGFLEASNVNAVAEMTSMLALSRQFELHIKMMHTAEEDGAAAARVLQIS